MLRHATITLPTIDESDATERWQPDQRYARERLIWLVDPIGSIPGEGLLPSRTWAVARALVAAGHQVLWWTSSFSHTRKIPRTPPLQILAEEGFQVRLIAARGYRREFSLARFASHREFSRTFERVACESVAAGQLARPDLLLATSPPPESAEAAARIALRLDAELVVDVAEWWPEPLRPLLPGPAWLATVVSGLLFPTIRRHQRQVLSDADALLANSQTTADQILSAELAERPLKVVPTGSYVQDYPPPKPLIEQIPPVGQDSLHQPSPPLPDLAIAVAGDLDDRADLLLLVDLARALASRQVNAVMHVVGGGRRMPQLASAAPLVKGTCRIKCHGMLDRGRYVSLLADCRLGLVLPGLLDRFPSPAVASDYAAAGLAVLVAGTGELADLICGAEAGEAIEAADANALAEAIALLATAPRRLSQQRQAARRLAETCLDRERLAAEVVQWLESLAVQPRQAEAAIKS